MLDIDRIRSVCLAFPHATENVQWGNDLVFKAAGKMFAVAALEPGPHCLSFKTTPGGFAELTERPGIVPSPYLAWAHWVSLESGRAMPSAEIERRLREAYDLTVAKLPKRTRAGLGL
jgi:predicted DNA-binding protein (MmcQ/YjbR family)